MQEDNRKWSRALFFGFIILKAGLSATGINPSRQLLGMTRSFSQSFSCLMCSQPGQDQGNETGHFDG
jgi:hypothetical protein